MVNIQLFVCHLIFYSIVNYSFGGRPGAARRRSPLGFAIRSVLRTAAFSRARRAPGAATPCFAASKIYNICVHIINHFSLTIYNY